MKFICIVKKASKSNFKVEQIELNDYTGFHKILNVSELKIAERMIGNKAYTFYYEGEPLIREKKFSSYIGSGDRLEVIYGPLLIVNYNYEQDTIVSLNKEDVENIMHYIKQIKINDMLENVIVEKLIEEKKEN